MKQIRVPFGTGHFTVAVPGGTEVLCLKPSRPIRDLGRVVETSLEAPIGSPPLRSVVDSAGKAGILRVAIALSDVTRPTPYCGKNGILPPLLRYLEACGVKPGNITLIVATGMHRPSTNEEKVRMYGTNVVERYRVIDHDCEAAEGLAAIGRTGGGTVVSVNRLFREADLRIATGLVESHFMAGFSGGRKSVCPGLVNKATIERFHGPDFLESPLATNLVLDGNPCHEEALEVATMAGVHFIVNVTVDSNFRATGVFSGHMAEAHREAAAATAASVTIPLKRAYDIVLTHAGYVGINHYQAAKTACSALPAVAEGGRLIIAADNHDTDPVGTVEYRTLLHLLKLQGPAAYIDLLRSPSWSFTKDQWEPEMWARALKKLGEEGLIYCAPQITLKDFDCIPGVSGYTFLTGKSPASALMTAQLMVQAALNETTRLFREAHGREPAIAFIADGPYAVPVPPSRPFL